MEPRIRARFNDEMLQDALGQYQATLLETLDGFESFIYRIESDGRPYILRITHSSRRDAGLVQAEVDWINYLANHGVAAAGAIRSISGELVVAIDDGQGEQFLATGFEVAPGVPPWETTWTPTLYAAYGQLLGRMHRLSTDYVPPAGHGIRMQWDDPIMQDMERNIPRSETVVLERYRSVFQHAQTLPKSDVTFGLVHWDAHEANLHIGSSDTITLFDFDDCCYNWFAYDLAIVLFYMVTNKPQPTALLDAFLPHFLRGYGSEFHLAPMWLAEIPTFLKLREIDLYAVIHRSMTADEIAAYPWCAAFMAGRRQRIEQSLLYVNYDWLSLAQWL